MPVVPTPTITYYTPSGSKPWTIIPTVVVSSAANNPRIPLAKKAVDYWNQQFKEIGTPFHLGPIVQTTMRLSDEDLIAIANPATVRNFSPAGKKLLDNMPGDLVIALSDATFVSATFNGGAKQITAIQACPGGQDSAIVNMNVIAMK